MTQTQSPVFETFFDPELRNPSPYNERNQYVARAKKRIDSTSLLLKDVIPGRAVLDIGASPFYFLWKCRQMGAARTTGVFYSQDDHPLARAGTLHTAQGPIELAHCDAVHERLPWPDATFDVVTAFEVLEHFPEYPALLMSEVSRVLKPGGTLAITVPNACSLKKLAKIIMNENTFMKYRPDSFGRHNHEYTDWQLKALIRVANCDLRDIRYLSESTANKRSAVANFILKVMLMIPGMGRFKPVIAARGQCRGPVPFESVEYAPELYEARHSVEM